MKPTAPLKLNRLAKEKSPYLLQHQHNPVDWYPWGEEAFARAKREQKPIFLSVGYSTCHWCHVMAHESFESEEIAKLVNEHFVAIKVDREERPDVDRVYMTYVQATTGGGGWPMTVFLTPDLQPFYGGTYFPPEDKFGRPGFPTVLKRLSEAWRDDRENILQSAKSAIAQLRVFTAAAPAEGSAGKAEIMNAYEQLARAFDEEWGGFGKAPKFPQPVALNLLFRVYAREGRASTDGKVALGMTVATLDKMAAGGVHDHLGGGFHRYSVDRFWHIPHFEKMLYDQAQLASAYLDAYQVTHAERHAEVARAILEYVLRDMTDKGGGFYSAEDADSIIAHDKPEHAEGAFYVWTKAEIDAALGTERAPIFNRYYGVEEKGNAPEGSDPHKEFVGKNTLIVRMTLAEAAKAAGQSEEAVAAMLAKSREQLLALRAQRPRPHLDDKIITAWNGLMISAFAKAGQILGEPKYVTAAQRAAQFLKAQLWKDGRLIRNYRGEASNIAGFADDYAFLIQGLLDLYEADFDVAWLQWAEELQKAMDPQFWDAQHGGYFSGQAGAADILLRMKEDHDGAEPSPNSVAALNLQRLAQILGSTELKTKADKTMAAFSQRLTELPTAMPLMLCAVDYALTKPRQIVIAGAPAAADTQALLKEVHRHFLPGKLLLVANGGEAQAWMAKHMEFVGTVQPIEGKAAAYVCENFACQLPTTDPQKLRELLTK